MNCMYLYSGIHLEILSGAKKLYENIWWEHQVMHTKGGRKGGAAMCMFSLTSDLGSDCLMQLVNFLPQSHLIQLFLSLLRLAHAVLLQLSSLKTYPSLATLLAALKANMTAGLPGQPKVLASIQPPLSGEK